MKKITLSIKYQYLFSCPECGTDVDYTETKDYLDNDYKLMDYFIFNDKWDRLKDRVVECPYCSTSSIIEYVEPY